jgi:hypothetical protein
VSPDEASTLFAGSDHVTSWFLGPGALALTRFDYDLATVLRIQADAINGPTPTTRPR